MGFGATPIRFIGSIRPARCCANATADDPQDLIVANVNKYGLDALFPANSAAVREGYEKDNMANFTKSTFEDDLQ